MPTFGEPTSIPTIPRSAQRPYTQALQAGQSGYVFMNVKKGIPFYLGSSRNGVTSSDWNNAGGNYVTLTFQSTLAVGDERRLAFSATATNTAMRGPAISAYGDSLSSSERGFARLVPSLRRPNALFQRNRLVRRQRLGQQSVYRRFLAGRSRRT